MKIKSFIYLLILMTLPVFFLGCFYEPLQWSGDGKTITGYIFSQDKEDNEQLQLVSINVDTGSTQVIHTFDKDHAGRYIYMSPTGDSFSYLRPLEDATGEQGDETSVIIHSISEDTSQSIATIYFPGNEDQGLFNPWHPQGKSFLYLDMDMPSGLQQLYRYNLESKESQLVLSGYSLMLPAWSPDGQTIAVCAWKKPFEEENVVDLVLLESNGVQTILFQSLPGSKKDELTMFLAPAWSPDNEQVVLTNDDNLILVNTKTGSKIPLTSGDAVLICPAVSPDGKTIAFNKFTSQESSEEKKDEYGADTITICLIDVDGKNKRTLVSLPGEAYMPAWSPDGKNIAFFYAQDPVAGFLPAVTDLSGKITWFPVNGYQKVMLSKLYLFLANEKDSALSAEEKEVYRKKGKELIFEIIRKYPESSWADEAGKVLQVD